MGSSFKKKAFTIPKWLGAILSLALALLVWQLISMSPTGGKVFASPVEVFKSAIETAKSGLLSKHFIASTKRIITGFLLAFICSLPVAFILGWYKNICMLVEPWIQFLKNIPPISYIPLVIVAVGVGEESKVVVIFIACFLTMTITIFQGVKNVDNTLIKAARVLGANDFTIFFNVVIPASSPFILTAMRLGLSSALTTLIAAEMTGAAKGLGVMIQSSSQYFRMDIVLMGILIIGVLGLLLQKIVRLLEKQVASWQDTIEEG
ncbi:MAG: ABC transporter permease [Spirochaetales bacterium]|nr:ABC transporter permease [Spirochaetales bacterium]